LSKAHRLSDENHVDAPGLFLVDLQHFANDAVLPVRRIRTRVLQLEAVLDDPLTRGLGVAEELLRADDEDDIGRAPGVRSELTPGRACSSARAPSSTTCARCS
jgi:hypothetical protein